MVSEEGLNAYGATTWGQFFIYQGFNEKTGWMHTSTGTDIIDEFKETIVTRKPAKRTHQDNTLEVEMQTQTEITGAFLD